MHQISSTYCHGKIDEMDWTNELSISKVDGTFFGESSQNSVTVEYFHATLFLQVSEGNELRAWINYYPRQNSW